MSVSSPTTPFILLSLLTGLISSFVNPIMSFFLVEGIKVEPIYIGVYTVSVTLIGVVISQFMGALADKGVGATKLYLLAIWSLAAGVVSFMNVTSFWLVLVIGILFMTVASAAVPQMLTISRFWADTQDVNVIKFNAQIRAALSAAWVIGPPSAFLLVSWIGFNGAFSAAAIFVVVATLFVLTILKPSNGPKIITNEDTPKQPIPLSAWLIVLAVLAGSSGNILYSSSMPLYLMQEKGMPGYLPGILMGSVAALEIGIMLRAAKIASRIGQDKVMAVSFVFAALFYLGMFYAESMWQFITLQLVNACFYGLFAGIGLSLLQSELPNRTGTSSALYSNSIRLGVMVGTTLTGIFGQFVSFAAANIGAIVMATVGFSAMWVYSFVQQRYQAN